MLSNQRQFSLNFNYIFGLVKKKKNIVSFHLQHFKCNLRSNDDMVEQISNSVIILRKKKQAITYITYITFNVTYAILEWKYIWERKKTSLSYTCNLT